MMTRNADRYVPLRQRVRMANEAGADLFISMHLNASPGHNRAGHEVFILPHEATGYEIARLARLRKQEDDGGTAPAVLNWVNASSSHWNRPVSTGGAIIWLSLSSKISALFSGLRETVV